MGNLASSCTTGTPLSHASSPSPPAAPPPPPAHSPAPHLYIARLLLIDGSMLTFRNPVRVTKLLLDYPNHLVCLLDSLTPGLHSLSTLLPDDKLQLGRLYLLLPFKSNAAMRDHSRTIKSTQKRVHEKLTPLDDIMQERAGSEMRSTGDKLRVGFAACANVYKKSEDVGLNRSYELQSSSLLQRADQQEHMISRKKGDNHAGSRSWQRKNPGKGSAKLEVGSEGVAEIRKKDNVAGRPGATSCSSYGKLQSEKKTGRSIREMRSSRWCNNGEEENYAAMKEGGLQAADASSCKAREKHAGSSSICDTPELQRAYRSLLRRSSSWTPRLQPIVERR